MTSRWACFALWGPRACDDPGAADARPARLRLHADARADRRRRAGARAAGHVRRRGAAGSSTARPSTAPGCGGTLWEAGSRTACSRVRLPGDRLDAAREGLPRVGGGHHARRDPVRGRARLLRAPDKSFIGSDALAGRAARRLRCIALEDPRSVALGNEPVRIGGEIVGRVTSGGYGYTRRSARSPTPTCPPASGSATPSRSTSSAGGSGGEVVAEPLFDPRGRSAVRGSPLRYPPAMSVTVVGSIAFDAVTTPFGERERMLGGSAVHFALAASFFDAVHVVGPVGDDFGEAEFAVLREPRRRHRRHRARRRAARRSSGAASTAGTSTTARRSTPSSTCSPSSSPSSPSTPRRRRPVPGQHPARPPARGACAVPRRALRRARLDEPVDRDRPRLADRGDRRGRLPDAQRRRAAPADREPNLVRAARRIREWGPKVVVAKQGEYGAAMLTEEGFFGLPAFPLETVIDPTGAGDSFAGGFIGYIAAHPRRRARPRPAAPRDGVRHRARLLQRRGVRHRAGRHV